MPDERTNPERAPGTLADAPPAWRVLVVDDDAVDRMAVRRGLARGGVTAEVDDAEGALDALAKLGSTPYDCVFLDYNIPGGDGLTLLRGIRQAGIGIPVVVLTGQGDEQVAVELMKAGAVDYLPKAAATPDRLASSLRHAIELSRAESETRRIEQELRDSERRARFLAEASAALADSLDLRATLERVAQLAVPILGDYCLIYVANTVGGASAVASAHFDPARAAAARHVEEHFNPGPDHPTSGVIEVMRTRRSKLVERVTEEMIAAIAETEEDREVYRQLRPRTALYVPLIARDVLGAALFCRGDERPGFEPTDIALAEDLARRAATALDNARLYEAAERERARTERLQQVTARLATVVSREELGQLFVAEVRDALQADTSWLSLLSEDGTELVAQAEAGFAPGVLAPFARIPVDAPMPVRDVLRDGKPRWYPSREAVWRDYPELRAPMAKMRQEAVAVFPVYGPSGAMGVMTIGFRDVRTIADDELAMAVALAQQCGQALERARLYEAERKARAEVERAYDDAERARRQVEQTLREESALVETLQRVGSALTSELNLERLIQAVTDEATRLTGAKFGAFFYNVVDRAGERYTLYTISGVPREEFSKFPMPRNTQVFAPTFRGEGIVRSDDITKDPRYGHNAPYHGMPPGHLPVRSYLAMPVVSHTGEVLGGLFFGHTETGQFQPRHERLIIGIAGWAAVAIDNARLYESERRSRDEAEEARTQAEQANLAKSQFLATMSHELRTPLNAIGGYADLIAMGVHGPVTPDQAGALDRIRASQRHLLGLINEVLNYAKLEAGSVHYDVRDIEVASVVAAVETLVLPQVQHKRIAFAVDGCEPGTRVRADEEKLRQILLNLLSNAVRFTDRDGEIRVSCRRLTTSAAPMIELAVRDTGVGIAAENMERIFEPFVQVGRGLSSPGEGTGLGLAISRDLARGMGGDLRLESQLGVGSTFYLTVPAAE